MSDAAHFDSASKKWYLLGLCDAISSTRYPLLHQRLAVYFAFTDAHGRLPLRFRIIDANEERPPVAETRAERVIADPLLCYSLVVTFDNLTFPASGLYRVQVLACDEPVPVMERRLLLSMHAPEERFDRD